MDRWQIWSSLHPPGLELLELNMETYIMWSVLEKNFAWHGVDPTRDKIFAARYEGDE